MTITGFAGVLSERMQADHAVLAARWFERLRDLLPVGADEIFPTESLLDHIPGLIADISAYFRAPEAQAIAANTLVVDKARELGALRHQQKASLHQVLREYQLLGQVLTTFVREEVAQLDLAPTPDECIELMSRIHRALDVLMQETVETFVGLYTQTISAQAERLEQFTRMATHEWRQPLGSLQFAVRLLAQADLEPSRVLRTVELMDRNVAHLAEMTRKLERLARIRGESDSPIIQEVAIGVVAHEAARQLREMSEARGVRVHVSETLPMVCADVGRLELALLNLISNAIKYSDSNKPERVVEVTAGPTTAHECQIIVRDNGIGIPADSLPRIFDRFTRAHADRDDLEGVVGVGLGLSIVADCVSAMNGRIDVQSTETQGTTFLLSLPLVPAVQRSEVRGAEVGGACN